ncbi:glycosyltransferase family 4 protein [Neolewinella aurantiaca]|uniref:Glycosyltransferase family 4 protein n=1 Tax=Neolewinella aurantiaca TaxID=2602767 RepID=A0A5C7FJY5_9BACT|nr:glycosyltransferase family 4 protein [Neolewinella aurantiaca]TXF90964.1 glycosyltransferase family 4 protein [Neolewinella aurantiaca]
MKNGTRGVLFITQRFPPHTGAAARRLRYLAQNFSKTGDVFVIRAGVPGIELDEVKETLVIAASDLRKLSGKNGKTLSGKAKENFPVKQLLKARQAFPFLYLTDDGGVRYRQQAYHKACKLIEKHGITTVFSSFRPWSDHLVARQLKRKYPHLVWIADFRDLPVDPVRKDVWWPGLQKWWGRKVVARADEMWAVSEGQEEQFMGWHPNIKVQRNALLKMPPICSTPLTDRFTIVYTGSLYPGLQSVAPLVGALRKMLAAGTMSPEKLCLVYRGKDAPVFAEWTKELPAACLDIQPSIAPAAAQKMQQNAQLLLLLNWSAPGYFGVLTAKLWDYLATARPVLALVNGPGDKELKGIIEGANAGAVFADEEQGRLEKWLSEQYAAWLKNGELPWFPDRQKLTSYL